MTFSARLTLAAPLTAMTASLGLAIQPALAAPPGRTSMAAASHFGSSLYPGQCLPWSARVSSAVPWAQQRLQPTRVWPLTRGAGQLVAVLDTGVSAAAPALSGAVSRGLNVLTGGRGDSDCTGNGTFVAGIIAARSRPGVGFAGLAPRARILPVDVVDQNGNASSRTVAAGIDFAVARGATVIDVSTATGPSPALSAAVARAVASNVVVIAAVSSAGNGQVNQRSYPAAYPGVIAVSAVDSVTAPIATGQPGVRVDLAAPGYGIVSIGPRGPGELPASGAWVATAFVAGTAALVRSYYPRLTAAQVAHRLEMTADAPGTPLPDPGVGYGIVDPYTAITTVLPEESGGTPPPMRPEAVQLPPLQPADRWPKTAALIVCAVVGVAVAAGLAAAHILPRGRSRRWRPPATGIRDVAPTRPRHDRSA